MMLTHKSMFWYAGQQLPGIQEIQQVLALLSLQQVPITGNIGNDQNREFFKLNC